MRCRAAPGAARATSARSAWPGHHGEPRVRGRADGFDPDRGRLEEIKTHRGAGALACQPANHRALHWAQAMIYGWLLCERDGRAQIELCAGLLRHRQPPRDGVHPQLLDAETLRQHFVRCCEAYLAWRAASSTAARATPRWRRCASARRGLRAGQRPG